MRCGKVDRGAGALMSTSGALAGTDGVQRASLIDFYKDRFCDSQKYVFFKAWYDGVISVVT